MYIAGSSREQSFSRDSNGGERVTEAFQWRNQCGMEEAKDGESKTVARDQDARNADSARVCT